MSNNVYLGSTLAASHKVDAAIAAATLQSVNAALRKEVKADQFVFASRGEFKPGGFPVASSTLAGLAAPRSPREEHVHTDLLPQGKQACRQASTITSSKSTSTR